MDQDRWSQLTLAQQLANIGSEVHRVSQWHAKGEEKNKQQAADRTLELIDLTLADSRWKKRLKEITRLREVFCDIFLGKQVYRVSSDKINDYFLSFALLARK